MFKERRAEKRYAKKLASVATITHCDEDPSLHGCPIKCETFSISGHGIQFRSDLQLQPGTLLSITIAYKPTESYSVAGEVRWCKLENGEPTMAVQLLEDKDTDIEGWLELVSTGIDKLTDLE